MRLASAYAVALAALILLSLLPAPAALADTTAGSYARAAFRTTNHQRVKHDRVRLRKGDCLRGFARKQAVRMATREEVFHQDLQPILKKCAMRLVGENVAAGFPSGRSVVNDGWMKSKAHRANILERRYRRMAVVARKGDDGRWYVSQVFGRAA
ncbi:CAP domain-containing protein [Nocardioides koreensis]|uniref:CAP domain-containing protein n=1 Tax=Nocardioides koreensis TaxID=433651 RepID=A0ABP5LYF9_9ACTN